jgi:glycosyltransferase involved in cell wall biosynthesis
MKPDWEKGLRGRVYAWGRSVLPLAWRRAIRRRLAPERLLGIRKPVVEVERYDFDPREVRPGRPDLLFLPVIAWSYRRQRPQQLAEALGRRGKRVFYGAIRGPGEPDKATGVAPGVTVLPIAGVRREDPGDRRLDGRALESAFGSIAAARDEFDLDECAVVVESPYWAPLALRLRDRFGWKVVYDCLDEHAGFAKYRPGALREEEDALAGSADLVMATSTVLLERLLPRAPQARLLPNACDFELFSAAPDREEQSGEITVGYVGAVDDWFDAPLFDELVRLRPSWRFEVVGAGEGNAGSRPSPASNVFFRGERPHRELPALRARFDVEIIPFRLTPLTDAVDPVKLYEAAAAGRPVVATRMRSLLPLAERGVVRFASTAEEFAREIEAAALPSSSERDRLREFARENTWDVRAAELEGWLTALPSSRPRFAAADTDPAEIALAGRRAGALFVFPESVPWETTLVQRPHHLARALARRGFPVVFELPASGSAARRPRRIEENLYLVAGRIGELADAPVVYWSFPYNVPEAPRLSGARLVYDVIDHPDVFPHRRSLLKRNHERALGTADAVFAVSRPLWEEISRQRPDAVYLPNGVDFERYENAPDPAGVPERLARSRREGRPVAGFLGAFARWVDGDLLSDLARLRPDWDVVLIGERLDGSFDALGRKAPSNLLFAGAVPHRVVPSVLSAFDAGLIPFRLGPEGANASPIKLYEYLAAGLPVLATPIAEAEAVPEVLVASDAPGFAALLDRARSLRGSETFRDTARARARENGWSARVERALRVISDAAAAGHVRSNTT